jgi:hypothetical protein
VKLTDKQKQARRLRERAIGIRLKNYYQSGGVGWSAVVAGKKAQALEDEARALIDTNSGGERG